MMRCFSSGALLKGIDEAYAVVGLTGVEVLGEDFRAACLGCGGEDCGIPVGGLAAVFDSQCTPHDRLGQWDDEVAQPVLDESNRLQMAQWIGAGLPGGLNVKLLKHLNREHQVLPSENGCGRGFLLPLAGIR